MSFAVPFFFTKRKIYSINGKVYIARKIRVKIEEGVARYGVGVCCTLLPQTSAEVAGG